MDELKQLFKELLIMIQHYGDSSYNAQRDILKEIINYMEGDDTDINKFSQAKWAYKNLFFLKANYRSSIFGRKILLKEKS